MDLLRFVLDVDRPLDVDFLAFDDFNSSSDFDLDLRDGERLEPLTGDFDVFPSVAEDEVLLEDPDLDLVDFDVLEVCFAGDNISPLAGGVALLRSEK